MKKKRIYPALIKIVAAFLFTTFFPVLIFTNYFYPQNYKVNSEMIQKEMADDSQRVSNALNQSLKVFTKLVLI